MARAELHKLLLFDFDASPPSSGSLRGSGISRSWCEKYSNSTLLFPFLSGVRVLVDAREKLHIPWGKASNQQHGDTMMAFDTRSVMAQGHGMVEQKVFQHYLPSIRALWADEGIQNAYDRRREFQLVSVPALQHHRQRR